MTTETQRKLLYQLVKLFRSSRVLEIGTFTGVSTITMASALPTLSSSIIPNDANGNSSKLISLEIDPKAMNIARKHIQKLKDLDDRVELILGLAMESLKRITKERPGEQYDFIFIDADKGGYISYFDFIMDNNLLSDNGVIIADNVLFYGQVHRQAGYADMKPINFKRDIPGMAKQIHQFNEHVLNDKRVQVVILPLFDGVSIITKNK
ncbi:O-methyltransferase [Phascolomyces articulosus]|uniref:O-methyltransferase n=1 Tax=Phascolomyces articulosus TaxID=60185 RepID=A0AAD5PGG0_9FUNG|nr:O-methyltransferase [Phascolomyces articulosus]